MGYQRIIRGLTEGYQRVDICSGCDTKFCHRDFVLKYVVIRGKKGLSGRIGTFLGPILEQIGTFIVICTEMLNGLK